MRRETKDRLFRVLQIGSCVFLPWSVPMWILGGVIYGVRSIFADDASGDDFLILVVGAPLNLPLLLFAYLEDKVIVRRLKKNKQRSLEAAAWMISEFRRCGIHAEDRGGGHTIMLHADVVPEKIAAYRDVVAAAARRFSDLTQQDLYGYMVPRAPLDQAWAKQHGLTVYAVETFF